MATVSSRFHFYDSIAKFNAKKEQIPVTSIAFINQAAVENTPAEQFIYVNKVLFKTSFDASTIQAAIATIQGDITTLKGDKNTAGSVAKAVSDLETSIKAILGTGVTAENTVTAQLDALDSKIDGIEEAAGEALEEALKALTYTIETTNHQNGRAVVGVTQTDGKIAVTEGNVSAQYVTYTPEDEETTNTVLQDVIAELFEKIDSNEESGKFEVYKGSIADTNKVSTIAADGNDYIFAQGGVAVATLNIAKDMVVNGGGVITATGEEKKNATESAGLTAGDQYIKLTIKDSADVIYIPVSKLYKTHEGFTGTKIKVEVVSEPISADDPSQGSKNVIKASIVAGSIEKTDLTTALQNEIASGKTTITEASTGHIRVTKQAGTNGTPDNYTITGDDIASAALVGQLPSTGTSATTVVDYAKEVADAAVANVTGTAGDKLPSKLNLNSLKDAIDTLNGAETVDGSVAKAKKEAIDAAKAIKVNNKAQDTSSNITVGGADIAVTGYGETTVTDTTVAATDTVNQALKKIDTKVDNLSADSPVKYATGTASAAVLKGKNTTDLGLQATNDGELAVGKFNQSSTHATDAAGKTIFSVGAGASATDRSNAFEVRANGDMYIKYGSTAQKIQDILSNEIDWYYGD